MQISKKLKMNNDEKTYILLLLASIPIGLLFKIKYFNQAAQLKALAAACIGLLMAIIVCSYDIIHSVVLTLVNAFLFRTIHPK